MAASQHFKELLLSFQEYEVEFLIVGGYAVMKYSEPHYTKDLDIWVAATPENSARVFQALARFGTPLQLGVAPVRVDILTRISGVRFAEAWQNRAVDQAFGISVNFISLDDLIANKRASGRADDRRHLEALRKEQRNKSDAH